MISQPNIEALAGFSDHVVGGGGLGSGLSPILANVHNNLAFWDEVRISKDVSVEAVFILTLN